MERTPVKSSSVKSVGYENGVLEVEFAKGTVYRYKDVPAEVHAGLVGAESVGRHFQEHVRTAGFECERVEPETRKDDDNP